MSPSLLRRKREAPKSSPQPQYTHPLQQLLAESLPQIVKLIAEVKRNPSNGMSESLVLQALPLAVGMLSNSLQEITPEMCDNVCEQLNILNAKLCHERGAIPYSVLSGADGSRIVGGANGIGKNDTRALSAAVP